MKKFTICSALLFFSIVCVWAHTPLLFIEDNEDGTIFIEGGFSNGASASRLPVLIVEDKAYTGSEKSWEGKKILFAGSLDETGCMEIVKPAASKYVVVFDAGPGHIATVKGPKLTDEEKEDWETAIKENKKKIRKWESKLRGEE